jgi:hypothetical protein
MWKQMHIFPFHNGTKYGNHHFPINTASGFFKFPLCPFSTFQCHHISLSSNRRYSSNKYSLRRVVHEVHLECAAISPQIHYQKSYELSFLCCLLDLHLSTDKRQVSRRFGPFPRDHPQWILVARLSHIATRIQHRL